MALDLTRRNDWAVARRDRTLSRALSAEQLPAKRAAARVEAAAYVAFVGLVNTEILTTVEAQICQRQGALVDQRAKHVVDTYAGLCSTELARLALER